MARQSLKSVIRLIDDANKRKAPEEAFLADLERSIELTAELERRKPSQTYKPSSMNCIRSMYYQRVGIEPTETMNTYSSIGIMNSGSDIHVRLQKAIECMKYHGIDCEYVDVEEFIKKRKLKNLEVKSKQGMETKLFHTKLNMSFLTDGIVKYRGKYYIFEAKTETANKFFKRDGVDEKHKHQATAYSIAFDLDDVIFVYVDRDMLNMKSFMFHVTSDMKHNIIGLIDECEQHVKKLKVPAKPDIDKRVCGWCAYQKQCKKDI